MSQESESGQLSGQEQRPLDEREGISSGRASPLALAGCPAVVEVPENDGLRLIGSPNGGGFDRFIFPFSAGRWVFQASNRIAAAKAAELIGCVHQQSPCSSVQRAPASALAATRTDSAMFT
jgi:hypothetical protein